MRTCALAAGKVHAAATHTAHCWHTQLPTSQPDLHTKQLERMKLMLLTAASSFILHMYAASMQQQASMHPARTHACMQHACMQHACSKQADLRAGGPPALAACAHARQLPPSSCAAATCKLPASSSTAPELRRPRVCAPGHHTPVQAGSQQPAPRTASAAAVCGHAVDPGWKGSERCLPQQPAVLLLLPHLRARAHCERLCMQAGEPRACCCAASLTPATGSLLAVTSVMLRAPSTARSTRGCCDSAVQLASRAPLTASKRCTSACSATSSCCCAASSRSVVHQLLPPPLPAAATSATTMRGCRPGTLQQQPGSSGTRSHDACNQARLQNACDVHAQCSAATMQVMLSAYCSCTISRCSLKGQLLLGALITAVAPRHDAASAVQPGPLRRWQALLP